jgi:hypothetical protein
LFVHGKLSFMLSAIAARKAAQASHPGVIKASVQATEEESKESSSEPEEVVPLGNKRAKRKSSKIRSVSSRAKKRKARYFVEEQVPQEDVESDASTSDADGEELGSDAPWVVSKCTVAGFFR